MLQDALLYNQRPTGRQVKLTAGVAALLLLIFLSALPFRDIKLVALNSYIPTIESLLMLGDLITAALLLSQASIMRSGALIALGTAYFFSSLALIPHVLTFPDAFSHTGLLGARVNTSAWLYLFWRPGLPVGAIAYALLKKRSDWPGTWPSPNKIIVRCLAGATLLVVALTVLATVGDPLMPRLLSDSQHWYPTIVLYCALGLLLLDFIAIGLICRTFHSVLDLWLLLTLFTVTMELTMTGIIWGRFCVGWYVERTLGLFSGLLVLMLLLTETHRLYRQNMLRASTIERERERQLLIRDATVASIAHELRQPLSSILLNAYVGQTMVIRDDNEVLSLFSEIREAGDRATEIIESTRSLFSKSSVNKHPSDVNQIIRKSLALVSRDLKDHAVSVDLKLGESLPPVAANQLQMQEVFLNLFTNAMEAMSGQVGKPRVLTISSSRDDAGIVIRVQDTGPGIASEEIKQIFTPFHTTKKSGTGVGLTICQSIVSAHAGSLRVISGNAEGAAFDIYLPYDGTSVSVESGDVSSSSSAIPPSDALRRVPRPEHSVDKVPATLGDVLYAKSKTPVHEHVWARLVQSIAAGDQLALHELYEMAHRIVFALILRITANGQTSEELTIDVFHDVWRGASRYDAANGTVLAWIMNQARSRAIDRLPFENQEKRSHGGNIHVHAEVTADAQGHLALRIARETGKEAVLPPPRQWSEPEWEQVAPGIECKLLATDTERHRVSMLVRLAPGASYPAHTHAGVEELHLLDGELWIDERKLFPGDYNYGAPGASDERVWSATGCTCVLVTSTKDVLRV